VNRMTKRREASGVSCVKKIPPIRLKGKLYKRVERPMYGSECWAVDGTIERMDSRDENVKADECND